MKNKTNWEYFLIDIGDLVGGFILGLSLASQHLVGMAIGGGLAIGSFVYKFKNNFYK